MASVNDPFFGYVVILLGRNPQDLAHIGENTQQLELNYGPQEQYQGIALAIPQDGFSIGQGRVYLPDHQHFFLEDDWMLLRFKGEIVLNPRFVCSKCNFLSGVRTGTSSAQERHDVISCQNCTNQWMIPAPKRDSNASPTS